jgi:hypothetical protein
MKTVKRILKLILDLFKSGNEVDQISATSKYLYPIEVLKSTHNEHGIEASIKVDQNLCYIVNGVPLIASSNTFFIDKDSYPKAIIECYRILEKATTLGEFGVNNNPFKVLVRYESILSVCEVVSPGESPSYTYPVYKEYEMQTSIPQAIQPAKAVEPAKTITPAIKSTASLKSISAGNFSGGIGNSNLSNCVYDSIVVSIGAIRCDNIIVLKSLEGGIGDVKGTIYCLPTTTIQDSIGEIKAKVIRLSEEKLIVKAQELNLL